MEDAKYSNMHTVSSLDESKYSCHMEDPSMKQQFTSTNLAVGSCHPDDVNDSSMQVIKSEDGTITNSFILPPYLHWTRKFATIFCEWISHSRKSCGATTKTRNHLRKFQIRMIVQSNIEHLCSECLFLCFFFSLRNKLIKLFGFPSGQISSEYWPEIEV